MPYFLSQQDVYRVLQRELPPDDVYPDGAPSAFFSTAENFAVAKVISDAYLSASAIYQNFFPTTAVERLGDFESTYFGYTQDGSLSIDQRRARLLVQIRTQRRTTPGDILSTVYTILDPSVFVEIAEWGCGQAGWILDVSQLEIETILNEFNGLERTGPDLCTLDADDYGLTPDQFARLQDQAYIYEVRIYSYTLTAAERSRMESALNAAEPARSKHIILDGLDPNDSISGST